MHRFFVLVRCLHIATHQIAYESKKYKKNGESDAVVVFVAAPEQTLVQHSGDIRIEKKMESAIFDAPSPQTNKKKYPSMLHWLSNVR